MTTEHPVQRGQRYNRLITVVFAIGVAAFFVGMLANQTFAGLIVYAVAGLAGIASLLYLRFVSSVELADERSRRLHERTSGTVITLVAFVTLPIVIGLYLLDALAVYDIGPTLWGAIFALSGLYLTWGLVYVIYKYRA